MKVKLTRANPFEKSVVKNLPADVCDWYYVVDFQAIDTQKANALQYSFVVSMSGAVDRTELK